MMKSIKSSMKYTGCHPEFVITIGNKYYLGNNEYVIRGMNFGNYMWYNPTTPQTWYNDEESYRELSSAGFNTIRWYINYALLEDDDNPYMYKQSGLDWIDQNVLWAKKYGMKILLNMHIPQGAKASDSWDEHVGSLNLFYGSDATENRNRLTKMWEFLADRYKNETGIIGYGLLNEPRLPYINSLEETKSIWETYAQELVDTVRRVDENHILFIEPTTRIVDMTTGEDVIFDYGDSMFLVNDTNYAVEYHFYHPMELTHQATNTDYAIGAFTYPNENLVSVNNTEWVDDIYYQNGYDFNIRGYQHVESPLYHVTSLEAMNAGYVNLRVDNLGEGNLAYFDNIVVSEYDENGNYIRDVISYDCNTEDNYKIIPSLFDNLAYYSESDGVDGSGCIVVKDVVGEYAIINSDDFRYFPLVEGYKYKVSAQVKIDGSISTHINPTISFVKAESVTTLNKSFLEGRVSNFEAFGDMNNIPLYMGEFGTFVASLEYGGIQWINDMLDIINEQKISASYHEYKPGLYLTYSKDSVEGVRSDELYNVFMNKYT